MFLIAFKIRATIFVDSSISLSISFMSHSPSISSSISFSIVQYFSCNKLLIISHRLMSPFSGDIANSSASFASFVHTPRCPPRFARSRSKRSFASDIFQSFGYSLIIKLAPRWAPCNKASK